MSKRLTSAEQAEIDRVKRLLCPDLLEQNRQLDRQIRKLKREMEKIQSGERNTESMFIPYRTMYDEVIEQGTLAEKMGWRNRG